MPDRTAQRGDVETRPREASTATPSRRRDVAPSARLAPRLSQAIRETKERSAVGRRDRVYRLALTVADAVAALVAMDLAVVVAGDDGLTLASLAAVPLVILVSKLIGLYDRDELVLRKSTLDESPALFELATAYTLLFWLCEGFLVQGNLGKIQVVGLWGSLLVCTLLGRTFARMVARVRAPRERCIVVGDLRTAQTMVGRLGGAAATNAELVAQLPVDFRGDQAVTGAVLRDAIRAHDVHRVIIAPGTADSEGMLDAIRLVKSLGVKVSLLPRMLEVVGSSVVFDTVDGVTLLGVRRFGLTRSSAAVKRGMDLITASLGLFAVAPLFVGIALAVRLTSSGPIFFRQARVGRDGQHFEMLKFRSMVDGADAMKGVLREHNESEGLFKMTVDPRVTRVGRLLRSSSLDELPQLINVLRGDMSLVGPRPLVPDEDAMVHGWNRRRLHLTPGMTGPWQVIGSRQVPLQEMVKIDYIYIANWSFWIDVKILLRTVMYVARRAGV